MPEEKETKARPIVESTVKKESVDPTEKDLFEDVFGADKEKESAKELFKKKREEILSKKPKKELKENSEADSEEKIEKPAEKVNDKDIQKIEIGIEKAKTAKNEKINLEKESGTKEEIDIAPVVKVVSEKKPKEKKPKAKKTETEDEEEEIDSGPSAEKDKIREVIVKKAKKAAMDAPAIEEKEEDDIKEVGIREEKLEPEQKMERDIEELKEKQLADKIGLKPELSLIEYPEKNAVFIGRKKAIFEKYKDDGALYLGQIEESGKFDGKKVLLDSLNPHVVFVCGARGSGKCLHGDTLITLENGLVAPIKDLENIEGNVFGLDHGLKVKPLHRQGFYKRKVEKLLNLKLKSGKQIRLTPEHPLLTVNGWVPAEDIELGGRIATPRVLNSFGKLKMRDCDVKLLAYLLAEGHLSNQFVLFSNFDEKIIEEFKKSVGEFDENLRIEIHSKKGCFRIAQKRMKIDTSHIVRNEKGQFTNESFIVPQESSLMQWLESIGVYGKLSAQKFIPNEIMQLEKEQIAIFLNRLFSCDGSIYRINNREKNWAICYASSSEKLIRQVQHLLLRFGLNSRIREKQAKCNGKKFKSFELVMYAGNAINFIKEIGFYGKKELKAETAFNEMLSIERNPNNDTIPKEVWDFFKPKNWAEVGRKYGYSTPKSLSHSANYSPSREKLLKIAQIEENIGIQLLANAEIYWDEIAEIREEFGEFAVYDISVPTHQNFVANDIIVHNSYVLGIIAEELALKNKDVGVIVIDPIGVFWSMRFPNKEERELALLAKYDLLPQGLSNIKVFIPLGLKNEVPKSTYDATFAIQPSLLTTDDWCLTFGIERFSPTGLLLEKAIIKVKNGYKNKDGDVIKAKADRFSLEDLIRTLETDDELNSAERGYKADSIRALSSRFDAAKGWGVFSENGTPLSELSRENQLTIIDTSFLEDNVYALVIGILSRRILAARKISTRRAAAEKLKDADVDEALEMEIPPTWLFIDEAHTLIPSGNVKTPATNSLIEYVKQGRQPGCSLVFATQQPSAIDTKVLSQLDIIMAHKLIFDDDIKAVFKRTPTIIPAKYKASSFIKTLPVGTAVTGDRREETSRAFVMKIRPRMSQHEGREAETSEGAKELAPEKAKSLAVEMLYAKVEKEGILEISKIDSLLQILSGRYKANIPLSETLDELEKRGLQINPQKKIVLIPGRDVEEEEQNEKAKLKEQGNKGIEPEEIEGIEIGSKKALNSW